MHTNKQSGFSLVELALVMIIFGFTTSLVLLSLRTYTEQARVDRTTGAIDRSTAILSNFDGFNGRLPCPAPLNVGPGMAGFGIELAGAALDANTRQGRNDLDGDGINEDYVFGAVPVTTIENDATMSLLSTDDKNFGTKDGLDGWNNKLIYVVSRHLCDPGYTPSGSAAGAEFGNPQGVLDIVTEATCVSANPADPADPPGTIYPQSILPGTCGEADRRYAQFVVMSMGENGRGGWTENGTALENCIDALAVELTPADPGFGGIAGNTDWYSGFASERKNCKYSRADGAGRRNGEFFYGLASEGNDNTYYDDFIKFFYEDNFQIFSSASSLSATDSFGNPYEISRMQNVNTGEIGIGLQDPAEALHLDGDLQAFDIEAEEFCADIDTGLCMPVETLTTGGMECPRLGQPGSAIQAIELNNTVCADPFAGLSFACPLPNERLRTVRSDGTFECCDNTVSPIVCTNY